MKQLFRLEVAVFSADSALTAQALGAARVELNAPGSYHIGGLTPPLTELARVRRELRIPVHIMIRPRGAPASGHDFIYSPDEVANMILSIEVFKRSGLMNPDGDRFVFGALKELDFGCQGGRRNKVLVIDDALCKTMLDIAQPYGCVYHRAFDLLAEIPSRITSLNSLTAIGFTGLLTAGGRGCCGDKKNLLRLQRLCDEIRGNMHIIIGGGLRSHNLRHLLTNIAPPPSFTLWFHTAVVHADLGVATEDIDMEELTKIINLLELDPHQ